MRVEEGVRECRILARAREIQANKAEEGAVEVDFLRAQVSVWKDQVRAGQAPDINPNVMTGI